MSGKRIETQIRDMALEMVDDGMERQEVCTILGLHRSTLFTWVSKKEQGEDFWEPAETKPPGKATVSDVRRCCDLLDYGFRLTEVQRMTGFDTRTLIRWRDKPQYREATFEFNPVMSYNHEDLMDRAVVAQHLCHDCGRDERLELLFAVVGIGIEREPFSRPRWGSRLKEG